MPNWVGDLVMATPILAEVRKKFPRAHITAMCIKPICELLEQDENIDELFCFSKQKFSFDRRDAKKNIIEKLKAGEYDLGILLTNSFSSAWWFWQGKIKRRIGFKDHFRSFLLTDGVAIPENKEKMHQVEIYKKLLKPLGITSSDALPKIYLSDEEIKRAKELLYQRGYEDKRPLIGINPGAAYGEAKCWPPERFSEVARKIREKEDYNVVFFGDGKTAPLVKEITSGLDERVINLAGLTSLRELASIIQTCDVLLTNDSGPMHIAAALGTEVVALFGSTNDTKTGPYKKGGVINKKVKCSPCYKRTCPIDFSCMTSIQVDEVIELIKKHV